MRDSFLRKINLARSTAERMRLMEQLQAQSWRVLRSSPQGYAHFLKRNFAARAIEVKADDAS
jgi:hypothetical protein